MTAEKSFEGLVNYFENNNAVAEAKWFGKQCLSVNGKAFAVKFGEAVAFKLDSENLNMALAITGAKLFDPRGNGKPFKEWAQIPVVESAEWPTLAEKAMAYVESLKK